MLTLAAVAAACLLAVVGGRKVVQAQGKLTTEDKVEIQNTLARYYRYFDFPDVNPHEMVKDVWTPDGMFVLVGLPPASGQCPVVKADAPIGEWKSASADLIKGTITDKLGIKTCVTEVHGYDELAWRATNSYSHFGGGWRTIARPAYIEPMPWGARATVLAEQFAWDEKGGKWAGGGTYIEDMVKTQAGWRIKKRVWVPDNVIGKWRPAGAAPTTPR
jgi:hypothetical protein